MCTVIGISAHWLWFRLENIAVICFRSLSISHQCGMLMPPWSTQSTIMSRFSNRFWSSTFIILFSTTTTTDKGTMHLLIERRDLKGRSWNHVTMLLIWSDRHYHGWSSRIWRLLQVYSKEGFISLRLFRSNFGVNHCGRLLLGWISLAMCIQVMIGRWLTLMMGSYGIIYCAIKRISIVLLESREKFTEVIRGRCDLLLKFL